MTALSVQIEAPTGLTWDLWKRLVTEVENLGFAGLFRSDHFNFPGPVTPDSLELIVSLTYLANHSQRVHFGSLVAPLSFRDPIMLARQAAALDDLSGGRMVLGVGAGWMEFEHTMFGYELGDVPARMARLAEGLEVITRLLRSEDPVTYTGRFYRLQDAVLRPRPQRPGGPAILIGGAGPRWTLPLVAQYADVWNVPVVTPDGFWERSQRLDALLEERGRRKADVRRTVMVPVLCGRDETELEERMHVFRHTVVPEALHMPLADLSLAVQKMFVGTIVGTPDEVVERIEEYARAGVEELVIQWLGLSDFIGLRLLAEHVLPGLPA